MNMGRNSRMKRIIEDKDRYLEVDSALSPIRFVLVRVLGPAQGVVSV